jgi:[acyl-carrier-protein] S-malonyltransferase
MVGYLFAGQGSQYVGMGKDLYETFPESKAVFDKAEEALGFELKQHCFEGSQEILKITSISQPVILTVSIAALVAFKTRLNLEPKFAAGLSLGEYTALVAAGSLTLEDGLRLVRKRSEIMDEAARKSPGKMLAVLDLSFDQVKNICLHSGAEIANLNAPGQIVISGKAQAVEKAKQMCLESGAKRVIELEVSGGFHSSLMFEASVELKRILDNTPISAPAIPVISNYTAQPQYKVAQIKENLVCQMYSPVKWEESMRFMLTQGITRFYEFGPGKVLKGLMRKINPEAQVTGIEKKEDIENAS